MGCSGAGGAIPMQLQSICDGGGPATAGGECSRGGVVLAELVCLCGRLQNIWSDCTSAGHGESCICGCTCTCGCRSYVIPLPLPLPLPVVMAVQHQHLPSIQHSEAPTWANDNFGHFLGKEVGSYDRKQWRSTRPL